MSREDWFNVVFYSIVWYIFAHTNDSNISLQLIVIASIKLSVEYKTKEYKPFFVILIYLVSNLRLNIFFLISLLWFFPINGVLTLRKLKNTIHTMNLKVVILLLQEGHCFLANVSYPMFSFTWYVSWTLWNPIPLNCQI